MMPPNDQDRLMMQRQAATAERRNSPRAMIALATVVLVVAGIYAGLGFTKRGTSLKALGSAQLTQQNVQAQLEELGQLRNPGAGREGPVIFDRMISPIALLEQSAEKAEIDVPQYDSERSESETAAAHRRIFTFRQFTVADAGEVIRWASSVEQDIEGMRVHSLVLDVAGDKRGWTVNISFSRLEKKQ
jgi:hypothetical protein